MKDAHTGKEKTEASYESAPYVGTALLFNNLVLLAKRIEICPYTKKRVKYGGYWSIFCGAVEENEAHYIAAYREVLEETGLDLDKKMFVHQELVRDLRLYTYELDEMVHPILNYEHTEWGYFKIDQIKISPTPIDEEIADRIQAFRRTV